MVSDLLCAVFSDCAYRDVASAGLLQIDEVIAGCVNGNRLEGGHVIERCLVQRNKCSEQAIRILHFTVKCLRIGIGMCNNGCIRNNLAQKGVFLFQFPPQYIRIICDNDFHFMPRLQSDQIPCREPKGPCRFPPSKQSAAQ